MADKVETPWGEWEDIFRADEVVFKKITIKPGEAFSYQTHSQRTEFWFVYQGNGRLKSSPPDVDDQINSFRTTPLQMWSYTMIPAGMAHQIQNTGDVDMIVYEMQCGNCSEDDITRLEDKYGRE